MQRSPVTRRQRGAVPGWLDQVFPLPVCLSQLKLNCNNEYEWKTKSDDYCCHIYSSAQLGVVSCPPAKLIFILQVPDKCIYFFSTAGRILLFLFHLSFLTHNHVIHDICIALS